jgi:hypothetical protein
MITTTLGQQRHSSPQRVRRRHSDRNSDADALRFAGERRARRLAALRLHALRLDEDW